MLRVPGNSEHQVGVGEPADGGHGAPQRRARLFATLVQDVQQTHHHAQGDGGAGEKARQLCKKIIKYKYLDIRPDDIRWDSLLRKIHVR